MSEMKPLKREELYLNRLAGVEEQPLPDKPLTREELYYNRLCGGDNEIPETPLTRKELFLAKLNGEEVVTPEPLNRIEQYMAFATGETEDKPENPRTREEWYWDKYQGGAVPEEKTVTGNPIHVTDAVEETALALSVAFEPTQEATPFVGDTTTEPYLSKTASTTGNKRYLDKIVGGTVAWNQLMDESTNFSLSNATGSTVDGVCTFTASAQNGTAYKSVSGSSLVNHVLLGKISYKTTIATNDVDTRIFSTTVHGTATTNWQTTCLIAKASATSAKSIGVRDRRESDWDAIQTKDVMICDLTLMFSNAPAIADYVYSLEQATAGAGVQWLKDHGFIDDLYREYNPGELISAKPTAFTVGGDTYTLGGVDLRGLFKLDAQNNLYCDGDSCESDGTITQKMIPITLKGTESWEKYTSDDASYFRIRIGDLGSVINGNIISDKYLTTPIVSSTTNVGIWVSNSSGANRALLSIRPVGVSSMTVTQFKALLEENPVHCCYAVVTPTTSSSTPYTNPAPITNGDTESFIDTRSIPLPVGNNSHYAGEYAVQGKTGLTVNHAQTQEDTPTVYSVTFTEQGTVYGGVIDIVTGALNITWGYIASYNGETLTGRWLSSLDVYAEGTTPTTGAEVAYELASPITAELTPQQVDMLLGENTVWTDGNESMTLTYMSEAAKKVLAMNRKLATNKQNLEIKRNGGVIIDKPVVKPISGGLKK